MKRKISVLFLSYSLFLILLFTSGMLSGVLSEAVYFLSFILPILLALYLTRDEKPYRGKFLSLDKEGLKLTLPLIVPTISVTVIISYITAALIFLLTGKINSVDIGDSVFLAIVSHALLPALLEEALFRYIPMRLLAPHSKRAAVLISAFFFAMVHHDLFSIPYAFIGGMIFMVLDLALDSVIPSVIIHFINNAISVCTILYADIPIAVAAVYTALGVLTVLSMVVLLRKKDKYGALFASAMQRGERATITPEIIAFAIITLGISVVNLL